MFNNYYPKIKILKFLAEKEEIDGIEMLKNSIKLHLPRKANPYIIISKVLQELYADGFIESDAKPETKDIVRHSFRISVKGLKELQENEERTIRFWLPVILSNAIAFAALIIAVLAHIKQ